VWGGGGGNSLNQINDTRTRTYSINTRNGNVVPLCGGINDPNIVSVARDVANHKCMTSCPPGGVGDVCLCVSVCPLFFIVKFKENSQKENILRFDRHGNVKSILGLFSSEGLEDLLF
jgi:hypothetical protein